MTVRLTGFVLILALLGLSGYAALENARRASLAPAKPSEAAARAELGSAKVVLSAVAAKLERTTPDQPAPPCAAAAADYQIERSSCSTSAGVAGRGFAFAPGR